MAAVRLTRVQEPSQEEIDRRSRDMLINDFIFRVLFLGFFVSCVTGWEPGVLLFFLLFFVAIVFNVVRERRLEREEAIRAAQGGGTGRAAHSRPTLMFFPGVASPAVVYEAQPAEENGLTAVDPNNRVSGMPLEYQAPQRNGGKAAGGEEEETASTGSGGYGQAEYTAGVQVEEGDDRDRHCVMDGEQEADDATTTAVTIHDEPVKHIHTL